MSSLDVPLPQLIFGCGYLGRRVAARWLSAGQPVVALTRGNRTALEALGIQPLVGDVLDRASLHALPHANTVLYAVGLDRSGGKGMREVYVQGLEHVLDTLPPCKRFIYVSSTSGYGQRDGAVVDETSATEPIEPSGQVVLEAERLLQSRLPDAIILRFAGIYGPDRLLRRQTQLEAREPIAGDPNRWLNLIHVDDGASAILAAEARGVPGAIYNIADDTPQTRQQFYTQLAQILGAPEPIFDGEPDPRANHRRISNHQARTTLGWRPQYPSTEQGLVAAVAHSIL